MPDNREVFRQERRAAFVPQNPVVADHPEESSNESNVPMMTEAPPQVSIKNPPPELQRILKQNQKNTQPQTQPQQAQFAPEQREINTMNKYAQFSDKGLESVLIKLQKLGQYEEIQLPSLGKFYQNGEAPADGIIHVRPMTGAEEQILTTPRYVKKGTAMDKIFQQVIQEPIMPEKLLTIDRTYLLVYLRGISFSHEYDVDVECPSCGVAFQSVVDLNSLELTDCPEDFNESNLQGVMPNSGFKFKYRLSTGRDEQLVTSHREKMIKEFDNSGPDDTLLYRASILIEEIEGVTGQHAIQTIIARLPINDVAYLRNIINDPPFGMNTKLDFICPACTHEFKVDMPYEANFFFPRRKEEKRKKD